MLSRIGRFLKKVKSRKGYTLVEAATVVAITGAMAIVAVPIASDKIEDGKISTAGGSTQAIASAMVKFFGDTGFFPLANKGAAVSEGAITKNANRNKVMRSGLTKGGAAESTNNLDPDLDTTISSPSGNSVTNEAGSLASADLQLWAPGGVGLVSTNATGGITADTRAAKAGADSNLNNHIVADTPSSDGSGGGTATYASGGLNWFGPYVPAVDQDPWGRNYLIYIRALDPQSLEAVGAADTSAANILVPKTAANGSRIYAWVISSGPDEKLQTPPTNSILKGDDIGTLLSIPPVLKGKNDAKQK